MAYFRCTTGGSGKGNTLVVTCADDLAGATITCTNGTKTYNKTCPSTTPYEVTFYGLEAGTWTVSATVSGNTYTTTVVVTDYEAELGGFNWHTWVDASRTLDSSDYASLSEVLADEEALRQLFLVHDCVDYMAEATSANADIETIIGTDLAAKWINLSDYALDTLYANTVIKGYMDSADKYFYGEWVNNNGTWTPKGNVPVMTASNAPYGTASASEVANESYKAFDGDSSTYWASSSTTNQSISYTFTNPVCAKKVKIRPLFGTSSSTCRVKNFKIEGLSLTSGSWVTLYTGIWNDFTNAEKIFEIPNDDYYMAYHLLVIDTYAGGPAILTLQFYGRELSVSVPVMTSNTTPYGEASASSVYGGGMTAYRAFDGNASTYALSETGVTENTIDYHFVNPVVIKRADITCAQQSNPIKDFTIEGSNDGTNYTVLGTFTNQNPSTPTAYLLNNAEAYHYYRLNVTAINRTDSTNAYVAIYELQFYGLDYSEKEFEEGTTKKWLYDHGLELEPITIGSQCVKESVQIVCNGLSNDATSKTIANTTNGVNLSPYNMMRGIFGSKGKVGDDRFGAVLVFTGSTIDWGTSWLANEQYSSIPNPNTTIHLSVASINESKIVGFGCGGNGSRQLSISELWLE